MYSVIIIIIIIIITTNCVDQSVEQRTVTRPVQVVTEDIFIWTVRPRRSVNSLNCTV